MSTRVAKYLLNWVVYLMWLVFLMVATSYIFWCVFEKPAYRIVAREEPGGITRYVIQHKELGFLYMTDWMTTCFSLPEAKATFEKLMLDDQMARAINKASWKVVK